MKTIIKFQIIVFFLLILFSCKNERENRQVKLESLEICNVKIDLLNIENKIIVPSSYLVITEKDIKADFNVGEVETRIIGKEVSLSETEYVPLKIAIVDAKLKKIVNNSILSVKKAKQFTVSFEANSLDGMLEARVGDKLLTSPSFVDEGTKIRFQAIPNDEEFRVETWQRNGTQLNIYSEDYDVIVSSNLNIKINFKRGYRVVYNPNANNGKIEVKKGATTVAIGEIVEKNTSLEIKAIPNESYFFGYWIINGEKKLKDLDYKASVFSINIIEDMNIDAFMSTQGSLEISESGQDQMQELRINGTINFPHHYRDSNGGLVEKSFAIGKYEVTYELWNEVLEWSKSKQYTIASGKGSKGAYYNDGNDGKKKGMHENTLGSDKQPVTLIDYRSIIVWCNAYSEKMGRTPVYYADKEFKNAIRVSDESDIDTALGTQDNPYIKDEADGYRLPSLSEWEFVARLNKTLGSATVKIGNQTWHFLPYDYASGAKDRYTNIEELKKVAWFEGNSQLNEKEQTHEVGTLQANDVGCFDMSGNVYEVVEDWSVKRVSRFIKGGSFSAGNISQAIGIYSGINIEDSLRGVGFRLSRTLK